MRQEYIDISSELESKQIGNRMKLQYLYNYKYDLKLFKVQILVISNFSIIAVVNIVLSRKAIVQSNRQSRSVGNFNYNEKIFRAISNLVTLRKFHKILAKKCNSNFCIEVRPSMLVCRGWSTVLKTRMLLSRKKICEVVTFLNENVTIARCLLKKL